MKILKLYLIFALLIASISFIIWILGFTSTDEIINILAKAGSVLGVLFLTTLLIQTITKPNNQIKK
jgi:hypothetical protein